MKYKLNHLEELEAEAIYIIREALEISDMPVMLFSGGKDSILMSYLAHKAFYPAPLPFPMLHIDTGHNFPETIQFRDKWVKKLNAQLVVAYVQDAIDSGELKDEKGPQASRNALQTYVLLKTIKDCKFDLAFGGARRDEEKARAKERFFSHRNKIGQWNPKNQRPEIWHLFNGRKNEGEHFRVFPISNWTELDVWEYLSKEDIELPSLYFSHARECIKRDNVFLAKSDFLTLMPDEKIIRKNIRFRTIGDMTCTGGTLSSAKTMQEVIDEIATTKHTERAARSDDQVSSTAMEDRKKGGYF